MAAPFEERPLRNPNIVQRLFSRKPRRNLALAIGNVLAAAPRLVDVTGAQIEDAVTGLRDDAPARRLLPRLYEKHVRHCLAERNLSDDAIAEISHLQTLLGLSQEDVEAIRTRLARPAYETAVTEAVSDGRMTEDERAFLDKVRRHLVLDDDVAEDIYKKGAQAYLQKVTNQAVADARLSPEEEKELHDVAQSLGGNLSYSDKTRATLERFRLYWLIENGDVPTVEVDINLQRGEACYFVTDADWLEQRTVTRKTQYFASTKRLRIAKGWYWRTGTVQVARQQEDVMSLIDSGRLYLTSKRLLFMGGRRNSNIALTKVLQFTPYKDGVQIDKATGKSPFLRFEGNMELFAMLLQRAMDDSTR